MKFVTFALQLLDRVIQYTMILLMEEIMHQFLDSFSQYLQGNPASQVVGNGIYEPSTVAWPCPANPEGNKNIHHMTSLGFTTTPPKINMEPGNDGFQ